MAATMSQYRLLWGNVANEASVAARCACVACNSCTCGCSCRRAPDVEEEEWPC